eukprot:255337_1
MCCLYFILMMLLFLVSSKQPNFVIILMDDQDLLLDSPKYMPNLQSMIVSEGISMNNGFVNTPVCCPSRTELITGRYFHNIGAPSGQCMHIDATANLFSNTSIFSLMRNYGGYSNGVFGKLTNADGKYFCSKPQNMSKAGLSRVYSMCKQGNFYATKYFDKYDNGSFQYTNLSTTDASSYQTAQIGNKSIEWITEKLKLQQPFLAYIGAHCPHVQYVVPPWFANSISRNITAPRTPNFNVHVDNQIPYVMNNPKLDQTAIDNIDQIYRDRLESTLQVDVIINDLYQILDKYDELDNTYIIYLSDHGYHLGQWRVPCEKTLIYDTDIRIPYYIRGPNISYNSSSDIIVSNVDILPLILDLANISDDSLKEASFIDGKSFMWYILNTTNDVKEKQLEWRDQFLVEYIVGGSNVSVTYNMYYNTCATWYEVYNEGNVHGEIIRPDSYSNGELSVVYGTNIDEISNTYRMIRIINETHDWTYAEYVNYTYTQMDFENPLLFALYDLKTDKYQMNNIYTETSNDIKKELHEMLMQYGQCKSSSCP